MFLDLSPYGNLPSKDKLSLELLASSVERAVTSVGDAIDQRTSSLNEGAVFQKTSRKEHVAMYAEELVTSALEGSPELLRAILLDPRVEGLIMGSSLVEQLEKKGESGKPLLVEATHSPWDAIALLAVIALNQIDQKASSHALKELLERPYLEEHVLETALLFASTHKPIFYSELIPILSAFEKHPNETIRQHANDMLREITQVGIRLAEEVFGKEWRTLMRRGNRQMPEKDN